jgi:hypothetical protein
MPQNPAHDPAETTNPVETPYEVAESIETPYRYARVSFAASEMDLLILITGSLIVTLLGVSLTGASGNPLIAATLPTMFALTALMVLIDRTLSRTYPARTIAKVATKYGVEIPTEVFETRSQTPSPFVSNGQEYLLSVRQAQQGKKAQRWVLVLEHLKTPALP